MIIIVVIITIIITIIAQADHEQHVRAELDAPPGRDGLVRDRDLARCGYLIS